MALLALCMALVGFVGIVGVFFAVLCYACFSDNGEPPRWLFFPLPPFVLMFALGGVVLAFMPVVR